jgi:hypothetical protein
MAKNGYTTLNLPSALVDELKVWKMAFAASYGRTVSSAEMIRGMLDSLEDSDPGVVEELDCLVKKHPELEEKMGRFTSEKVED